MSAVTVDSRPGASASLRPMREEDLDAVMEIEVRAYPFAWTRGIFRDCLRAGYPSWVLADREGVIGYAIVSLAADEAHLLNLCVSPDAQSAGHGRRLLRAVCGAIKDRGAERVFLEVRPSNAPAIALYLSEGFADIGRRPRYYPAADGREDAVVMALELVARLG